MLFFRAKEIATLKGAWPPKYHPQLDEYVKAGRAISAQDRICVLVDFFERLELTLGKKPTIALEGSGSVDSSAAAASSG